MDFSGNTLMIKRMHIQQKLRKGYFEPVHYIIWRQWGLLLQWENLLKDSCKIAMLDGDDDERFYPSSTTHLKHFGPSRWLRNLLSQKLVFTSKENGQTKQIHGLIPVA